MSTLIDTHTHIYLPEFDQDLPYIMARASAAGVTTMLLPAIDSSSHAKMLEVAKSFNCLPMMGLHPCSVSANYLAEINIIKQHLEQQAFTAIGEIGLDLYWDKTFVKEQYEAFHEQIGIALTRNLPISIHSRNATDECIAVVKQYPGLKGVFHCFSGNAEQAAEAMSTGFYLGIGGVVTFKNGGLDKVIAEVGLNRIVLETDAPYLAPVPFRGKRNEPAYLSHVVQKLSALSGLLPEQVAAISMENARTLFNLS